MRRGVFQKLLKTEVDRRVRMCNLQSAKDCASVETSLATVHARAQEIKKQGDSDLLIYFCGRYARTWSYLGMFDLVSRIPCVIDFIKWAHDLRRIQSLGTAV